VPAQWEHYWHVGCQERPVVAAVAVAAVAATAAAAVAAVGGCFVPEEEEAEFELDRPLCVELTDF
jgi:TRAP-type C4-dicarboxylate transport system permease large subunit